MFGTQMNRRFWHGGLSLVAALMLTTGAMAQDAGAEGDDPTMIAIDVVIDDGFVHDWQEPVPEEDGTAVDGTDPNGGTDPVAGDGQTGDPVDDWVDDGSGGVVETDGTGDGVAPGDEVIIYNMDGGPEYCIDCNVGPTDLPLEAYQMGAEGPKVVADDAPVAHKAQRRTTHGLAMSAMHECLVLHPQTAWICEWQNGAGQ